MLKIHNEAFIITIGEFGIIFALHKKNKIVNKLLIKEFSPEATIKLNKLFAKNKHLDVYILLDTVDQSYKKKDYPYIKKNDLNHLIKRDLEADSDKDSVKNHIILKNSTNKEKSQKDKKWHCLFISASISKITQSCIDFIGQTPNRLVGIYMLALESANLFKSLKESIKSSSKIKDKKCDVFCLITQSKVSGIRQSIFYEDQLIFTRLLDYNCLDLHFAEKYEKDLKGTSEYLNRIFPEINISELETVNILPNESLKQISQIKNVDFNFINYTPYKASTIISKNLEIGPASSVCDLIFSKSFCESKKKILKFVTPKLQYVEKIFLAMKFSYFANLIMLMIIGFFCLHSISKINESEENITIAKAFKLTAIQRLNKTTIKALDSENLSEEEIINNQINIDRILDFGKLNEKIAKYEYVIFDQYHKMRILREYPVKFSEANFSLNNFESEKISPKISYRIDLSGKVINESGDIEDLFSEFDSVTSEVKKQFKGDKIRSSELSKNIDFTQKYYDYNIKFEIDGKIK